MISATPGPATHTAGREQRPVRATPRRQCRRVVLLATGTGERRPRLATSVGTSHAVGGRASCWRFARASGRPALPTSLHPCVRIHSSGLPSFRPQTLAPGSRCGSYGELGGSSFTTRVRQRQAGSPGKTENRPTSARTFSAPLPPRAMAATPSASSGSSPPAAPASDGSLASETPASAGMHPLSRVPHSARGCTRPAGGAGRPPWVL